jgi:hypothetical protein
MHLIVTEAEYLERLAGHLASVGFEVLIAGPQDLEVVGLGDDPSVAADDLEPFLRVWSRLYPDVGIELGVRR